MGIATFHEKSSLEKKLWFPENSKFFEIHNFRQNSPKLVTPRREFPGICVSNLCKNARIYGFLEILETKFGFFPEKCRPQFLVFVEIWGHPFLEFPGILVDSTPKNARIYAFPGILELKFRFFPGNFCQNFWFSRKSGVDIFTNSREFWSTEPRKMQEYTGFPEFSS